jgi:hypothetical protein
VRRNERETGVRGVFRGKEGLKEYVGIFAVEKLDAEARRFLCPHGEESYRDPRQRSEPGRRKAIRPYQAKEHESS